MNSSQLSLSILDFKLAVCRLDKNSEIPNWAYESDFFAITKTNDELSIVCDQNKVSNNIQAELDWKAFKVEGPLDFSLTGILSSLAQPLANAKISIFAISTFDTDYLLVKEANLEQATKILSSFCDILDKK